MKNILFITPEFFGIEKSLIKAMEAKGNTVTWFNERAITSSFAKAINSVNPHIFDSYSNRYYSRIIERNNRKFDQIIIVRGEMVTKKTLSAFRSKYPNAELVLYLWDPVINIKGILPRVKLYDRVISFEPKDCKKYGFEFRALFCDLDKTPEVCINTDLDEYDVCFYGTMYRDRFHVVHLMKEFCKKNNKRFYTFCFLRGRFMGLYYCVTNKGYRELGSDAISYIPKSSAEIAGIIEVSTIILDINDPYQGGLTIRTLETLVSGKKMITTNPEIVNYDFYNSNNICVIGRDKIEVPNEFFETKYEPVPGNILRKYTAEGWVEDVIR